MTYLGPLRLHFAGSFRATPSTVNNDPRHYNNATFDPSILLQGGGNWNPLGDAIWLLHDCRVTTAWLSDGEPTAEDDCVLGSQVTDAGSERPARLVDLDPSQQLASAIWGFQVHLIDRNGQTLVSGDFEPAAFIDFWDRAGPGIGDNGAGAAYQSVLKNLEWSDAIRDSPMLGELRESAHELLSIKFNVDSFHGTPGTDRFGYGRIVGTIGPWFEHEPRHMVLGRHLMTPGTGTLDYTFYPTCDVNFCSAIVDEERRKIYLDLGNALPLAGEDGAPDPAVLGMVQLICWPGPGADLTSAHWLGVVPYREVDWYEETAGVVALPNNRQLTDDELAAARASPLAVVLSAGYEDDRVAITEPADGLYLRADDFVYRINPGDTDEVRVYATRFGKAYAEAEIVTFFDRLQLQGPSGYPLDIQPELDFPVGTPTEALEFPCRIATDEYGIARLAIRAHDPGNPRRYVDGQVYGLRPALEETLAVGSGYVFNQWDFISVLVWDQFIADPPTWHGSFASVFQQYANLYPVMKDNGIDLADYATVTDPRTKAWIFEAMSCGVQDPGYEPITRDMSRSKRQAILDWLSKDPPPEGTPAGLSAATSTARAGAGGPHLERLADSGGKTQAAARRLLHQRGG